MKYIGLNRIGWVLVCLMVYAVTPVQAQVEVRDPVFLEDFGTVPENWANGGRENDYSDGKNIDSYRGKLDMGGKDRGVIKYTFGKREKKFLVSSDKNLSLSDAFSDGRYGLVRNGKWVGNSDTWHGVLDHTGNENGLAFLTNAKAEANSLVFYHTVNKNNTLDGRGLTSGGMYQFKIFVANVEHSNIAGTLELGQKPNVAVRLRNGDDTLDYKATGDLRVTTDAPAWTEHILYAEIPWGKEDLRYDIISVNQGWKLIVWPGNIFVADDISVSPLEVMVNSVNVDFCKYPGKVFFEPVIDGVIDVNLKMHSRLMCRSLLGGDWEWCSPVVDSLGVSVADSLWLKYEFRVAVGFGRQALGNVDPNDATYLNRFGYYTLSDRLVTKEYCLSVDGMTPNYTEVPDSIHYTSAVSGVPEGATLYSRWMWQPFEGGEWQWLGRAEVDRLNQNIDWVTFSTGNFRCTYGFSAGLLNMLDCNTLQARELYAVTSNRIEGADYDISIFRESLISGSGEVNLILEMNAGVPLGAPVHTCWMRRPRSGGDWAKVASGSGLSLRVGLVTYSEFEYRVAVSLSETMIRNLDITALSDREVGYRVSQSLAGRDWRLEEIVNDFCSIPGSVKRTISFSSDYPAELAVTGRWRQRTSDGAWEWLPGVVQPSVERVEFNPTLADYLTHDYELVISWSRDSLIKWNADALPVERDYYILQDRFADVPLCLRVDTIEVKSEQRDIFKLCPVVVAEQENLPVYGRWMRKMKESSGWEWMGEIVERDFDLQISTDDFERYDYRFYVGMTEVVLQETDAVLVEKPYFSMKEIRGAEVQKPRFSEITIACISKRDLNRVTWSVNNSDGIKSFVYRIGNQGEEIRVDAAAKNEFELLIGQDSSFCLLSYEQEGVCDRIFRNDTLVFKYIPRLHISNFTDEFGCPGSEVLVRPQVRAEETVRYEWYRNDVLLEDQQDGSLKVNFEEKGEVPLRLAVSAEGSCPEDSVVYLITGEYPEISYEKQLVPKEVCVGQEFVMDYQDIHADRYRVTLKQTSMPGFVFYPGSGSIDPETGKLEIKSLQTLLAATEFMVGHEFTFHIQIFKTVERNGTSYECEKAFDYSFRVQSTVSSRYPSSLKLCGGGRLAVDLPEVELGGNQVSLYQWRIWDGEQLTEEVLASGEELMALDREMGQNWNGKRLRLTAECGCGTVIVQDIRLSIFSRDSNWIKGPEDIVLTGDKVSVEGSEIRIKDLAYQWESCRGREDWQMMTAETGNGISLYAPDTTMAYRRTILGEGWDCPDMQTAPWILNVFNNERENRIYIRPQDSLILAGSAVTLHSDAPLREKVGYRWEKYESGSWIAVDGEKGRELTCQPENITKYRRVALVGNTELLSNEVVINVYNNEQNRILLTEEVLLSGEKVKIMGNYVDIPGVGYSWYADAGEGWKKIEGQTGNNLEMVLRTQTKFVRYVYLPSLAEDSLCSNVVTACVFDNVQDNVIACENLNACAGTPVTVTGRKIDGEGVTYRWEYSEDGGKSWVVVRDASEQDYSFAPDRSMLLRRRVMYPGALEYYSNVLDLNVVHNSVDNVIEQTQLAIVGETVVIHGNQVQNALYRWEGSEDGEDNWVDLEGAVESDLVLEEGTVGNIQYVRRHLYFDGGTGCDGVSNVLKLKLFDPENGNRISGPESYVCQWSEFLLTGSDLDELNARYQWFRNDGNGWKRIELVSSRDMTVYEGCGKTAQFRRDVTIGEIHDESNVVEVRLWNEVDLDNTLKQPGVACAGQEVVIEGSDALDGDVDLSEYVRSYVWEVSLTGAGSTWRQVDSVGTRDLFLEDVDGPMWYCRIVKTGCGTDFRSEPVLLDVREQLKLTLRHDAPFGSLKPKKPITISIDEDYFDKYEIKVDGKTLSDEREGLFYGWLPKKDYQVVASVMTSTGCSQTDTMRMRTPEIDLPNVLTPNNDGYNDVLLENYDLRVYNRWGSLLYSGTDGWDGRFKGNLVPAGTYFYVVRIEHEDGVVTEYKNSVTVKR